jgi:hypothetical protein
MSEQIRIRVRTSYHFDGTNYYYSPDKILLYPEQLIIIVMTSPYVILIKQIKVSERCQNKILL